jgi:peptidyl-prolyl cis-trans isomerase D
MLNTFRKYSTSTGVKILYGVLALAFIIWGVGAVGMGQRMDVVAKVYGEPISQRDLDRATAALQRRYEELFKGNVQIPGLNLRGQALDQLLDEALLEHEAARLGLAVTDGELVSAVTHMPEFQRDGRFDRDLLERLLQAQRDRGEFEEQLRRSLLFQRLQALVTDGVQVSPAEVEAQYRLDHDRVSLRVVKIAAADLGKDVTPTDEELRKYLADHADRYRVPERVRVRYVAYREVDFLPEATVSDEAIQAYYDDHKDDRFSDPEQVRLRHIVVSLPADADEARRAAARKKAEDLLARIRAGADFAAVAKQASDDAASAAKGGELGLVARGRLPAAVEDAAFALEPGKVSDVIETPGGFEIVKVEEHLPGGPKPLAAVREEIVQVLRNQRALELARARAEADRAAVVHGKSLAEAAGGRPVVETPPFAATDPIPGVGRLKAFADAAFALGDGEVSDLIETEDAVYLLSPFAREPAHVPPLEDLRDRVLADFRRARGEQLARDRAEALRAQAATDGLVKAAAAARLEVIETGPFDRRTAAIPKLGVAPELRADAFALTPEAPLAPKVYVVGGDAVVAALAERLPADMTGFAAAKEQLADRLLQQKRTEITTAYLDFLKRRAQQEGALDVRADALGQG